MTDQFRHALQDAVETAYGTITNFRTIVDEPTFAIVDGQCAFAHEFKTRAWWNGDRYVMYDPVLSLDQDHALQLNKDGLTIRYRPTDVVDSAYAAFSETMAAHGYPCEIRVTGGGRTPGDSD